MEGRELPVGWVGVDLCEVCTKIVDGSHNPPKASLSGLPMLSARNIESRGISLNADYRLIEPDGFEVENRRTQIVKGDVLLTIVGAIGRTAVVPEELLPLTLQRSVAVLKPSLGISSRYLAYALESPSSQKYLLDNAKGTAQKGIYLKTLGGLSLHLSPSDEQRRIAAKLDTTLAAVDACRQRLDGVAAILKRFRQAVLAAATSGELTREWRDERGITAEWETQALSGICVSISDGDHQAPPKTAEGIPFITISAINSAVLRVDRATRFVPQSYYDGLGDARRAREDDILFSVTGSVGIPALVDSPQRFVFQRHIALLRPDGGMVLPRFLYFSLLDENVKRQCLGVATGTAQLTISLGSLRALMISIPSLQEQAQVVSCVDGLFTLTDQLEARLNAARKVVDRLTPALLAKAFRGELVPQDPNDEPASVLLERIRAARQAEAGAGKPSRRGRPKAAANPDQLPLNAAPVPSEPLPPNLLTQLLQECGALSERALLAASELEPEGFFTQLERELRLGSIRQSREEGQVLLEAVS